MHPSEVEQFSKAQIIAKLESSKAELRCQDVVCALESLGFDVHDGKKQGHKIVLHGGIPAFFSASFTCEYDRDPEIRPVYVKNLLTVLRRHEDDRTRPYR